jgi:BirA family biotin operon repressor/biotin-[acetyl-CoA-carboxylase] ligase
VSGKLVLSSPPELESAIADVIFSRRDAKISISDLACVVHASPARTVEAIRQLKKLGYPLHLSRESIEHHPFRRIDLQQLGADLATERIGRRIEWRLHVCSTQDELKKLKSEALDGTVVIAETQYGGRGRLTRSWFSALGGVWMSILLRPTWPESHQILSLALAGAVARAIGDVTKLSSVLKWPNDLMIRSRKVAGLLVEATYQGNQLEYLILGLGINANIDIACLPKAFRGLSTSLSHELGREVDRTMLARRIIEEVDRSYQDFESGHADELLEGVKPLCSTLGKKVRLTTAEGTFKGEALDLGNEGQLKVRMPDGTVVPFFAADVTHLR